MSLTVELDEQTAAVVQKLAANEQRSASEVIHVASTPSTIPMMLSTRRSQRSSKWNPARCSSRSFFWPRVRRVLGRTMSDHEQPLRLRPAG